MLISFLDLGIDVGVILGVVYSMFFFSYLCIHVGVMFALIEFFLVSFLSLCIRDGASFGSVYSLSMSIQVTVPELVSCLALYIHVGLSVWICVGSFYYIDEYTKPRKYTLITYRIKT